MIRLPHLIPIATLALLLVARAAAVAATPDAQGIEFFETKVRPVFAQRCYSCHSASAVKLKSGLRLDMAQGFFKGGDSGTPAIVPGKPDDSQLITAIRYEQEALRMPPKEKLPPAEIEAIEAWVKMGAPYPEEPAGVPHAAAAGAATSAPAVATTMATTTPTSPTTPMTLAEGRKFWSFQPPRESAVPQVDSGAGAQNQIDSFIFAKLKESGLHPSLRADQRTLIRRATYELTGLPPCAKEVEEFVHDAPADAFARLVDRLLASPRYGERWGRYWLDVARYADTKGYVFEEERRYAFSYTYRDWVIRALNEDLPYDQFLIQQIAADRLNLKDDKRPLAALGFLTLGRRFLNNPPDIIDDRIDVVTRGTMALTVSCARCHDHKYDPVPTADYYSLYGVFASSHEPAELPLLGEKTPEGEKFEKELAAKRQTVSGFHTKRDAELTAEIRTPESIRKYLEAAQRAAGAADDKALNGWLLKRWRDYVAKPTTRPATTQPGDQAVAFALADPTSPINLAPGEVRQLYSLADNAKVRQLERDVQAFIATSPDSPPRAMAMEDLPQPVEPHIFKRGNPANVGAAVPRQFPAILCAAERKPFTQGSGRLELAQAIASKDNPLTARVIVNRVWQYHFGYGLVRTPADFGTRGEPPTHPELLDWLALRFMNDDGWSLKKLHRRIMLSAAYQQASVDDDANARAKDPENRLLWRQNPQRLDFEALRDSLLAASGQLDLKMGGRSVDVTAEPFVPRRTIYAFIERQNLPGLFRTFDFASPDSTTARRFTTSVPQQALFMMNSPFVMEQARKLAARPDIARETDPARRVQRMYAQVFQREPSRKEIELALNYVNSNEPNPDELAKSGPTPWRYGFGEIDEATQLVKKFRPLPHFTGSAWQGGDSLPDARLGWASLSAAGGHPGDLKHAVIRQWIAPRDCTIAIGGQLSHVSDQGDGVRARIISSRDGALASWVVRHKTAETAISGITLKSGDTIDFIVDCGVRGDVGYDSFAWKITITKQPTPDKVAGDDTGSGWDSVKEFSGPRATPMTAWEKYAQVLLESNEFTFVD